MRTVHVHVHMYTCVLIVWWLVGTCMHTWWVGVIVLFYNGLYLASSFFLVFQLPEGVEETQPRRRTGPTAVRSLVFVKKILIK